MRSELEPEEIEKYRKGTVMLAEDFWKLTKEKKLPKGFKWWCVPAEGDYRLKVKLIKKD